MNNLLRGGLEGRYNLCVAEDGAALDSGRYNRKDRHAAVSPTDSQLAEIQIHCDENFQTKAEINARKAWADYKAKHNLCDQKVRQVFKLIPKNRTDFGLNP